MNSSRHWIVASLFWLALPTHATFGGGEVEAVSKFYLVRHAEKAGSTGDVALNSEGIKRAHHLQSLMRSVPLSAIYSTDTLRTKQTVEPISNATNLKPKIYPESGQSVQQWADKLIAKHEGDHVLIVGHSGGPQQLFSIPSIAQALSGSPAPTITGEQYNNLFVVTVLYEDSGSTSRRFHRTWYGDLEFVERPKINEDDHDIEKGKDISAVAKSGDFLVIGSDEGDSVQALKIETNGDKHTYVAQKAHSLENDGELDIEGIARVGTTYYVLGSHSRKRDKIDSNDEDTLNNAYSDNLDLLRAINLGPEPGRTHIYRVRFDPESGEPPSFSGDRDLQLRDVFQGHTVLGPFETLASKENGIDIEGIAADDDWLYLGFRAPVFRLGFVPVMRVEFDDQSTASLLYVTLDGRGIRDITKVPSGFLIVAGPVGDSSETYRLYHWDGNDCIPGKRGDGDPAQGRTTLLGTIPTPAGGKAEGIAVVEQSADAYQVVIAFDSIKNGGFTVFRAPRPQ